MVFIHSFVLFLYLASFVVIAETVYWLSKKEYLKAKAKYLRQLVEQTNNLNDPDHSFYSCIYDNWSPKEMNLSKAYTECSLLNSTPTT